MDNIKFKDTVLLKSGETVSFNTAMQDVATGENWFNSVIVKPTGKMMSFIKFTLDDVKEVI